MNSTFNILLNLEAQLGMQWQGQEGGQVVCKTELLVEQRSKTHHTLEF